mgnify:CR=1 FL=1
MPHEGVPFCIQLEVHMKALQDLTALLTDQEGNVCIHGNSLGRSLIRRVLTRVRTVACVNKSLTADNNYLRDRIAELSAERDNLLVQVGDNDCDALREYSARVIEAVAGMTLSTWSLRDVANRVRAGTYKVFP